MSAQNGKTPPLVDKKPDPPKATGFRFVVKDGRLVLERTDAAGEGPEQKSVFSLSFMDNQANRTGSMASRFFTGDSTKQHKPAGFQAALTSHIQQKRR